MFGLRIGARFVVSEGMPSTTGSALVLRGEMGVGVLLSDDKRLFRANGFPDRRKTVSDVRGPREQREETYDDLDLHLDLLGNHAIGTRPSLFLSLYDFPPYSVTAGLQRLI